MKGPRRACDLSGTDGAVEVLSVEGDDVTIGILNPDGSRAEMSGNGTRIAAAWLMSRTGSTSARVHVGKRTVAVRRIDAGLFESELGPVEVGAPEMVDGDRADPGFGGQSSRGRRRRSEPHRGARAPARGASALSRADERAGRARRPARRSHRPSLGARRGGDRRRPARALSPSRPRRTATARSSCTFPAATSGCDLRGVKRGSRAGGAARRIAGLPAEKPARTRNRFGDIVASEGGGRATPPFGWGCAQAAIELEREVGRRHALRRLDRLYDESEGATLRCRSRTRAARR